MNPYKFQDFSERVAAPDGKELKKNAKANKEYIERQAEKAVESLLAKGWKKEDFAEALKRLIESPPL